MTLSYNIFLKFSISLKAEIYVKTTQCNHLSRQALHLKEKANLIGLKFRNFFEKMIVV